MPSYYRNKQTYYINLRSNDAIVTETDEGNNYKFEWLIKNINLSPQARMCVTSVAYQDPEMETPPDIPLVIRSNQVKNHNVFDSANCVGTIIYISNMLHIPTIQNWFPLNNQCLERIELYFTNSIHFTNNGIANDLTFYIQLKIEDYETEPVDAKLMPTYTRDSLAFHYGLNV